MKVAVIGRPGSDYRKKVDGWLGKVRLAQAQAVFNYGLQGQKLRDFEAANPRLLDLPILNHTHHGNKLDCIKTVSKAGMSAPRSWKRAEYKAQPPRGKVKLIAKPYYSLGGKGIERVDGVDDVNGRTHYMQEEITDRRYELRCICMSWIDPNKWLFQKRVHPDGNAELAWNNHNGGKFITVENPKEALFKRVRDDVEKMLPLLGYQFGAVDFIIKNNPGGKLKHYFIEWNLAPGWTMERSEIWYHENFLKLNDVALEDFEAYETGMLWEDLKDDDPAPPKKFDGLGIDWGRMEDPPDVDVNAAPEGGFRFYGENANAPQQAIVPPTGMILQETDINKAHLNITGEIGKYKVTRCNECDNKFYTLIDFELICPYCGMDLE